MQYATQTMQSDIRVCLKETKKKEERKSASGEKPLHWPHVHLVFMLEMCILQLILWMPNCQHMLQLVNSSKVFIKIRKYYQVPGWLVAHATPAFVRSFFPRRRQIADCLTTDTKRYVQSLG